MLKRSDLVREIESALTRAPVKGKSARYAVYVPGAVVIGTYNSQDEARRVAATWAESVDGIVVVDRSAPISSTHR